MNLLIKNLTIKNAISRNTELEIKTHRGFVKEIVFEQDEIAFVCTCIIDGSTIHIAADEILKVDGMTLDRIGRIFNINPDGSIKDVGKKRGRRAKNPICVENDLL